MRMVLVDEASEAIEARLVAGSLEDVLRAARVTKELDAEEAAAADSIRPTIAVFHGEPWT